MFMGVIAWKHLCEVHGTSHAVEFHADLSAARTYVETLGGSCVINSTRAEAGLCHVITEGDWPVNYPRGTLLLCHH